MKYFLMLVCLLILCPESQAFSLTKLIVKPVVSVITAPVKIIQTVIVTYEAIPLIENQDYKTLDVLYSELNADKL